MKKRLDKVTALREWNAAKRRLAIQTVERHVKQIGEAESKPEVRRHELAIRKIEREWNEKLY